MTRCQAQILRAIKEFEAENGYTPSIRELQEHLRRNRFRVGASVGTIHHHLEGLEREGKITRERGHWGLRVVA